jgi:ABC-type proline/glycine betaine transport system ATPase subunit
VVLTGRTAQKQVVNQELSVLPVQIVNSLVRCCVGRLADGVQSDGTKSTYQTGALIDSLSLPTADFTEKLETDLEGGQQERTWTIS